ncbi:MAG: beta-N-acetylhexosaminidase [Balneolaceae bacterium]
MKLTPLFLWALLPILVFAQSPTEQISIIPKPVEVIKSEGFFELKENSKILITNSSLRNSTLATQLKDLLDTATWFDLPIVSQATEQDTVVSLVLAPLPQTKNPEAYTLSVTPAKVEITAATEQGLFYGLQSLRQLLPVEIEHRDPSFIPRTFAWKIPSAEIFDEPRFGYRGMHLDVGRHFQPIEFVKKYIDLIAMHKMNRFHWHLTEDQGWRIEIKKYPKLTEIGAWRDSTSIRRPVQKLATYDSKRHGGFYTQDEIREVVAYAQSKYITVIPEIELPGHSSAALAAYPELGCVDKEYKVQSTFGIFEDIFCPREETFAFFEDVFDEVLELFPSEYIHIGGDEAPKKQWEESEFAQSVIKREGLKDELELQSYFVQRVERYLNSKGRQIIGWDEILEGGLAPRATVMSWQEEVGGIEAAKMKHDVIMTPWSTNYFDHYQGDIATEPLAIGFYTPLTQVYNYEPIPKELTEEEGKYVLGSQGNLWTEFIHTPEKIEYMALPRMTALSEVLWTPKEDKDWFSFWGRLQIQFKRFDNLGVNYAKHFKGKMGN